MEDIHLREKQNSEIAATPSTSTMAAEVAASLNGSDMATLQPAGSLVAAAPAYQFIPPGVPRVARSNWLQATGMRVDPAQIGSLAAVLQVQSLVSSDARHHTFQWDYSCFQDKTSSNQNVTFQLTMPFVAKCDAAVWQVSTFPFPTDLTNWQTPPGLVFGWTLPAPPTKPGVGVQFSINIAKLDAANWAPLHPATNPVPSPIFGLLGSLIPGLGWLRPASPPPPHIPNPRPYYVRVAVLAGDQVIALSNSVTVLYGTPNATYLPDYSLYDHPQIALSWYTPIYPEKPNAQFHYVATRDGFSVMGFRHFNAGEHVDLTPNDDDKPWYDKLADDLNDAFSAIGNFFESAVDWVSAAYNGIIDDVVAEAATLTHVDPQVLKMAVGIGLSAVGLPPSLPNFDQLVDYGADYLVDYAADQAHISRIAAETMVKALKTKVADAAGGAAAGQGNPFFFGLKPDPCYQRQPAMLMLTATAGTQANATVPVNLVIVETGTTLFQSVSSIRIPSLAAGTSLQVPVFLRESTSANPQTQSALEQQYQTGTTTWQISTMAADSATHVLPQGQWAIQPANPWGAAPQRDCP